MAKERIYILHKNGANSHYTGLKHLLEQNDKELVYYEFCVLSKLVKSITKFRFQLFLKQLKNICFFILLFFTKNQKIVVGIAPYDFRLIKLLFYLRNHEVYYHSSWTCWDKTFYPSRKKNSPKIFEAWKFFLEKKVKHHFVVTEQTKNQLIANYKIEASKISVVNHSLKQEFLKSNIQIDRINNSFIYLGRLLPQKGIEELLSFFQKHSDYRLTIIGKGKLKNSISRIASEHSNIILKEHISNIDNLIKEVKSHQFTILNSKKTAKWEELFGLVIIEAMSLGTIPIASNHSGPKEIISENTGYLFEEGNFDVCLSNIVNNGGFDQVKSDNCIMESKKYSPENIALTWKPILL